MRIAVLSPFHSGSHRAWAQGYQSASRHQVSLETMPGQFWKWRMHGAAPEFAARSIEFVRGADAVVATDLLDLATFLGLARRWTPDVVTAVYFHENQLTYPLSDDPARGAMRRQRGERDQHYAWVNYTSLLAADVAIWNSLHHLEEFFEELPRLLNHFPDARENLPIGELRSRCVVLPPGVQPPAPLSSKGSSEQSIGALATDRQAEPCLVLWNHRWEYDKGPDAFLGSLLRLQAEGCPFRVALCGENQRQAPQEFLEARARMGNRVVHFGWAEEARYRELLVAADIVVSTARHEFFGMAVVEAMAHGAFPVLPRRLSYPEILPAEFHAACLYDGDDPTPLLRRAIEEPELRRSVTARLGTAMLEFTWPELAPKYDALLENLVGSMGSSPHHA